MNKRYAILSALLRYPDATLRADRPDILEALPQAEISRQANARLARRLGVGDPLDREEAYVRLFDRDRGTSLHLFEHVHHDTRNRGPAMLEFATIYETTGYAMDAHELPDFLPMVLEFGAVTLGVRHVSVLGYCALLPPLHRKPSPQHMQPEFRRLPSIEDQPDCIRHQQRQHPTRPQVAPIRLLPGRHSVTDRSGRRLASSSTDAPTMAPRTPLHVPVESETQPAEDDPCYPPIMETKSPVPLAVLVGIQLPDITDIMHEASLQELGRLVKTLGYEVVGSVSQKRDGTGAGLLLGSGKLAELATMTGGSGVVGSMAAPSRSKARERFEGAPGVTAPVESEPDAARKPEFVIVDHELSPSQIRNLERATGAQVLDRTGVIVEIFHRHANTREAKLQVEMARLKYVAPRLRESSGGGGRQQGPGAGETSLDLDRRKIRDRISELKDQLEAVQRDSEQRRAGRRDQLRVALVGYTNAGKSSLMRALTGSQVLVEDKLFATLDTTVRALQPETKPRVLVSDTVGFIKQLPHDLVASFRSTLAEALEASLLLYVVDGSDPTYEAQLEVSRSVLREIGADVVPSRLVLNKLDRVDAVGRAALMEKHPDAILLSAHAPEDVSALRDTIIGFFEGMMVDDVLVLPYAKQGLIGEVYESARVLSEDYNEEGRVLNVRGLPGAIARLRRSLVAN